MSMKIHLWIRLMRMEDSQLEFEVISPKSSDLLLYIYILKFCCIEYFEIHLNLLFIIIHLILERLCSWRETGIFQRLNRYMKNHWTDWRTILHFLWSWNSMSSPSHIQYHTSPSWCIYWSCSEHPISKNCFSLPCSYWNLTAPGRNLWGVMSPDST